MPRVKRGTVRRAKRKKLLARAKGYYQTKSKLYRAAKESVDTAGKYAYVGRKNKKRDFRRLWIVRINAAARENGLTYGQLIRGLKAGDAINQLAFSHKAIARDVKKVLMSAIANAENNHDLDVDQLFITEASVGKSMVMKRFKPRARGRAGRIVKPFSRIRIVVEQRDEEAA